MNEKKTTYLTFSSQQLNLHFNELTITSNQNNLTIKQSMSIKYLGITVDQNLRWNLHAQNLTKRIRHFLFMFKSLSHILHTSQMKLLYHSFIQSQLSYGIVAWGSLSKCYLKSLEVIQKWILKIIYRREKTYPSDDLFRESEVLDIRQLYSYNVLMLQRKHNLISFPDHDYNTRHKRTVGVKIKCKKAIGQKSYTYLGQKLYELMPQYIKDITNFSSYKKQVKAWLLHTPRDVIANIF